MVDMILVRQERVLPVAYPMQVDPDHVAARNQQGREGQHHRMYISSIIVRVAHGQLETKEAEHHADGQAACITHEDLLPVLGVPKNIVIEERNKHSQCGERQHGIDILMEHEKSQTIKQAGDTAQPGSQPVDAVDQVDGIDDEDHDQNG